MPEPAASSRAYDVRGEFAAIWSKDAFNTALFMGLLAGLAWAPFWLGGNRPLAWGVNGILVSIANNTLRDILADTGSTTPRRAAALSGPCQFVCSCCDLDLRPVISDFAPSVNSSDLADG